MAAKEDLIYKALKVSNTRAQLLQEGGNSVFLDDLNARKPVPWQK